MLCRFQPLFLTLDSHLKVVNKKMKTEVAVGDVVQAGFVISNSEVGLGHLTVEPRIFRLG